METISCKVCNCKNFKKIFDQDYPLKKYDGTIEKVVIEDVICKKCGLVYRNPMPSLKELIDYYSHKSSSNNSYKFELMSEDVEHRPDTADELKNDQYRYFESEISNYFKKYTKGKMLEIGCYQGAFLNIAKKNGWDVEGIEPSQINSKLASKKYGINVKNGFFDSSFFEESEFNSVVILHVLEHVREPFKVLLDISKVLKRNGVLFIEVPCIETMPVNDISPLSSYEHLYNFSVNTLTSLLKMVGFEIFSISSQFTGPIIRCIAINKRNNINQENPISTFKGESKIISRIEDHYNFINKIKLRLKEIVNDLKTTNQTVAVYGAGVHTFRLFQMSELQACNIVSIVDGDPSKMGESFYNHRIQNPNSLIDSKPENIIISSYAYQNEIKRVIEQLSINTNIISLYDDDEIFSLENMLN